MTVVAITGHRPEKMGDPAWVEEELTRVLTKLAPTRLYQGMAAGVDLLSAVVSKQLEIPYVAARPWAGHTPRIQDKALYEQVLEAADEVVNVSPEVTYPGPKVYHARNEYMVDHADTVVAVWDGGDSGGTAACVRYAKRKGLTIIRLDPIRQSTTMLRTAPKVEPPKTLALFD